MKNATTSKIKPRALMQHSSHRRRRRVFLYATVVVVIMAFVSAIINDRVLQQQLTRRQQEQGQQWQGLRQNESAAAITPHTDKTPGTATTTTTNTSTRSILEDEDNGNDNDNTSTDKASPPTYKHIYPPPYQPYLKPGRDVSIAIKPIYGAHRPDQDVVMTVARGYELPQIIYFIKSLLETGFKGDIVVGMAPSMSNETKAFLTHHSNHNNVVTYEIPLECGRPMRGTLCNVVDMFQATEYDGSTIMLKDLRQRRVVAQLRFEYYWAWTTEYSSTSRILITDSRDVYFQTNPFTNLTKNMETTLHVYEDTDKIKNNIPETNWIRNIYNQTMLDEIGDLPGICSGTTIGGQPAMEMYNRAMVKEWDETSTKNRIAMDQGRHIVLVLRNKLVGAPNITTVNKIKLGAGEVNTIGIPLIGLLKAGIPLSEWKGYDSRNELILNNDGSVTPVVHMFDRHPLLKEIINNRTQMALLKWNETMSAGAMTPHTDKRPLHVDILDELHQLTGGDKSIECPSSLMPFYNRIVREETRSAETTNSNDTSRTERTSNGRLIPKIIHVSMKSRCLPQDLMEYMNRWIQQLPTYSIFFHDDEAVDRVISSEWHEFPDLHRAMHCVQYTGAMTIDIWRILILYRYGGVYSDIDNWLTDEFTEDTIPSNVTAFTFSDVWSRPSQWFLAFEPRHPIMYLAMKQIIHNIFNIKNVIKPQIVFTTGPGPVKDAYQMVMERETKKDEKIDIFAPGLHYGAFGNILFKAQHSGIGQNNVLINAGFHNFHDIVGVHGDGKDMTRRERIEMETGVLHFTKQRKFNSAQASSCREELAKLDEEEGRNHEEMTTKDKNGEDAFGFTEPE